MAVWPRHSASRSRPRCRGPTALAQGSAAEEPAEWHRAMAPGAEVGENTTHGLALSRLKHGFESRWGNQLIFVDVLPGSLDDGNPSARHLCSIGSRHSVLS